jgi:hypothetical protein
MFLLDNEFFEVKNNTVLSESLKQIAYGHL